MSCKILISRFFRYNLEFSSSADKIFSGRILKYKILPEQSTRQNLELRKILKIRDLAKKPTSQQFCWQNPDFFLYDHDLGSLSPCLIPFQSEVREKDKIEQGHPTTISGKYVFGRRFEI